MQEACDLLEYANHPGGTDWSRPARVANGAAEPYGIRLWCLGNEMDGPWQIGHKTADEYGRLAAETAKAMRLVDPDIELVACGSSNCGDADLRRVGGDRARATPTTPSTTSRLHAYYEERDGDLASFLASAVDMDHFIDVGGRDRRRTCGPSAGSRKQINLSFDEWNVWYQHEFAGAHQPRAPSSAPRLIEDTYSVADAVVVGSLLISLLRHADRVKIACQAQLVNVIGLLRTEAGGPAWRQTIFHPFAQTARLARGTSLRVEPSGASHETALHGLVDTVDASATWNPETGDVAVFLVNRHPTEPVVVTVDARGFAGLQVSECLRLEDDDPRRTNTAAHPDAVQLRPDPDVRVEGGCVELRLSPASWTAVALTSTP